MGRRIVNVKRKELTVKQQNFVLAYAGNTREAAEKAGYAKKFAAQTGARLLNNPLVSKAIRERENERISSDIASREQRQKFWSEMMNDTDEKPEVRLRASELLGKSEGDFLDRVEANISHEPGVIVMPVPHDLRGDYAES